MPPAGRGGPPPTDPPPRGGGCPPPTPSLGTLIRIGNDFLFSGEWWIALFPSAVLAATVFSVNFLGDRLRDVLNPVLKG